MLLGNKVAEKMEQTLEQAIDEPEVIGEPEHYIKHIYWG